ncbi:MBL fold metallo-hydrolase [Bdellovibrio sp. HCB209]|uniref:MBL fold metallo-hydrolase n=1 Tax=Bdellovibrio sp. HCB209 TaxID=3394354 RepID=UPI0039B56F0E
MAVKISRIFHAGYVFECDGVQIAFDPIFENPFSRNCYSYPAVQFDYSAIKALRFDAVFISHHHDDHCSFDSLKLLNRETPIYMFCVHEEMFSWIRELGFKKVYPLVLDGSANVGPFEVISRPALDVDIDSIFQVKVEGLNILNVVDSWIDEDTFKALKSEKPWDLVMWPFQTMRELEVLEPSKAEPSDRKLPPEWLEQILSLNPRNLIPSSCQFRMEEWSWYNHAFFPISYTDFAEQIGEILAETRIINLHPTTRIELSKNGIKDASAIPWAHLAEDKNRDYEYKPDLPPPQTSEIAKHFPKLNADQSNTVTSFCKKDLIAKFAEVGPSADIFFNKSRHWLLSVYSDTGAETQYNYRIDDDQMTLLDTKPAIIDWHTEVIAAKLYSALTTGESLTSLYLRVEKTADVEVIEDPLMRCLFNGEFGSYQKAQLERIKKEESL